MNHKKQYDLLVERYLKLDLKKDPNKVGRLERHHILPTAIGGLDEPENIVMLTTKAHIVAHHLLAKIYGSKMLTAYWMMIHTRAGVKGVYWDKSRDKWVARMKLFGKNRHLGRYTLFNDAVIARWSAELEYGFAIIIF